MDEKLVVPIWETAAEKPYSSTGDRTCVIDGCDRKMSTKRLCRPHYQLMLLGNLDPKTGMSKRELRAAIAGGDSKTATLIPKSFKGDDAYIFLISTSELLDKATGKRIHIKNASIAWGNWIYDKVKAEKIKHFYDEVWIPTPKWVDSEVYNSYKPLESLVPGESEALAKPLEILLQNLGGKDYEWLLDWFAYKFRNPWECTCALVINGVQRAGKGTLESVMRAIFGEYCGSIDSLALDQDFNNWADRKFMIVADEISTVTARDKDKVRKQLKKYTAPNTLLINKKYSNSYNVNNYATWLIFSNDQRVVEIEEGDRRFSVLSVGTPITDELGKEISGNAKTYGQNLVNHLQDRKLDYFQPGQPLDNAARKVMQNLSKMRVVG